MRTRYLLAVLFLFGLSSPLKAQIHDLSHELLTLSSATVEVAGKQAVHVYDSGPVATTYNGVIIQGMAEVKTWQGHIRFEEQTGWSVWHDLYIVPSATDGFFAGGYRGEQYRTDQRFQLRLSIEASKSIVLTDAGVFDNRKDEDHAPAIETGFEPRGGATGLIIPPMLITRSEWGAESFRGTPVSLNQPDYMRMTFHHAAGYRATTKAEGLLQVKAIQDLHQNVRGWSDIGYQFVVDRGGHVYQGRPFLDNSDSFNDVPQLAMGAHVGGANTGNIGVCILGCYHPPETAYTCEDVITPAALDTMTTVFAFLSENYGVAPTNLLGHRDQGSTSCPGDNNYALLPQIRSDIAQLLVTGNQPIGQASLAAAVDETGVVNINWSFLEVQDILSYRIERTYQGETTVVYSGLGTVPERFTDTSLSGEGTAIYTLFATSSTGREQQLARTEVIFSLPAAYTLSSNFPNPFQTTTTIRYYLPQEGLVRLKVYDLLGREVANLVDAFQEGEQWHAFTFDGSSLSSGTYLYRLQVEGFNGIVFDKTETLVVAQ